MEQVTALKLVTGHQLAQRAELHERVRVLEAVFDLEGRRGCSLRNSCDSADEGGAPGATCAQPGGGPRPEAPAGQAAQPRGQADVIDARIHEVFEFEDEKAGHRAPY